MKNPISILIKPASGNCNMRCRYCFYADEQENREVSSYGQMSEDTMRRLLTSKLTDYRYKLAIYSEKLSGLSPLNQLARGYAYVTDMSGNAVTTTEGLLPEDLIHIRLSDGEAEAQIISVREDKDNGESKEH